MATIAIDFDGTCVKHRYPSVGENIGAAPILSKLINKGHKLILSTMRGTDSYLDEAIKWFNDNNIPLYSIQINPTQTVWTNSTKVLADMYIGDDALGCPLIKENGERYVDWKKAEQLLIEENYL